MADGGSSGTPVFLVLSNTGAIVETFLDAENAVRRAVALGGLIVPLAATDDYRADAQQRRDVHAAPFRPVPDVR
jgi:hypothetical protein